VHKEDLKLAKQLLSGNEQVFETFFNQYYVRVYRFCLRRVNENEAEDIALETMRQAMRRIETYRGEASLLAWVYQVARSQVSAFYKRAQKHKDLLLIEDDLQVQAQVEAMSSELSADPEASRDQQQHANLIHYMLDSLPGDYGRILEWKYVEGWSVEEIAQRLESSPTAIQSMLARARTAFRNAYEQISQSAEQTNVVPFGSGGAQT
jgi:RNA polymerase sigma-70 factor (ECF subfamily)